MSDPTPPAFIPPMPPGPAPMVRPPSGVASSRRMSSHLRETTVSETGRPAWADLELFRLMSLESIENLRDAMEPVYFSAGEVILRQGDPGDAMYLLDQGTVRVTVRTGLRDTMFEKNLDAPALFGEMALVTHVPRTATVTAEGPVRCLRVLAADFRGLMRKYPQVGAFLTQAVGERLLEAATIQSVGKYRVVGRLGAGAVATVFEAVHPTLNRPVALKMLSHAMVSHPRFAEQFQQEATIVAQLDHPHIVKVLDTESAYGTHFIVMEKLSGSTLDDIIQADTQLAWGAIRRILREIALALQFSHDHGLLHQDIKPSNVFLTDQDRRVKLLDFGIAAAAGSANVSGHLLGTPYYMSPEQILGRTMDGRSDLYSLGILAYELVTHAVPFDADTIDELLAKHVAEELPDPRELVPDVPDDLVEFILKATAKRPEDRYTTCAEAERFLKLATELPVVHRIELSTLAISYHPSRRAMVEQALAELTAKLGDVPGIALLHALQQSREPGKD